LEKLEIMKSCIIILLCMLVIGSQPDSDSRTMYIKKQKLSRGNEKFFTRLHRVFGNR